MRSGAPAPVLAALGSIFKALEGDERKLSEKTGGTVKADFVWPARRLAVEVDEVQHFTLYRELVFSHDPAGGALAFPPAAYVELCQSLRQQAEKAYAHVVVLEFPGAHSRARQRAYFDAVRDLVAPYFTAGALLRVPAPERDARLVLRRFEQLAQRTANSPGAAGGPRIIKNYANPVVWRPAKPPGP